MMKTNSSSTENNGYLWPYNEKMSKIILANPADFQKPAIIDELMKKGLIKDHGLSDEKEIRERNQLISLLFHDPRLRDKVKSWRETIKSAGRMPSSESEFLNIYGRKNNPYWDLVRDLISELDKNDAPCRIKTMVQDLRNDLIMEEAEKKMATNIAAQLEKVTEMEGLFSCLASKTEIDMSHDHSFIIGHKNYQAAWDIHYTAPLPEWANNLFCNITGIAWIAQKKANDKAKTRANRSAVITDFPDSLMYDLEREIRRVMEDKAIASCLDGKYLSLHFIYNKDGLNVKLLSLRNSTEMNEIDLSIKNNHISYSTKEKKMVKAGIAKITKAISEANDSRHMSTIYDFLEEAGWLTNMTRLDSPNTDHNFRWYALSNLYSAEENIEIYTNLVEQRRLLNANLQQLDNIGQIVELFLDEGKRCDVSICIPTIKEDGAGVSFQNLAPINLMKTGREKEKQKMIAFTLPTINGHIICLTGRHGGGKSTAGNSLLESVYLAQSGLPVFATKFAWDIKAVIGAVTNDKGEGSTATIFVSKIKNLFSEMGRVPKEKSLVFIDEIGKGTQEEAGLTLGAKILRTLKNRGYSVVFNTQILALAELAQSEMGAICLKTDKKHRFSTGIGGGEMEQLIQEIGLEKYLN